MHLALCDCFDAYACPINPGDPHLILRIETQYPIKLGEFVSTFVGLGSQYERFRDGEHPEARGEARFYVREVRAGSIIAELIPYSPYATPALGMIMAGVKHANDLVKFVDNVRDELKPYCIRMAERLM